MGIVNAVSKLNLAAKTFQKLFYQAVENDNSVYRQLLNMTAMEMTSTGDTESYNWLGEVPSMVEWIGERALKDIASYSYDIKNKTWANGIKVSKDIIMDDANKLGMVRPRILGLAEAYWRNRWNQVLYLFNHAHTLTCYDGQYFSDTDHSEGDSGTQSNYETDLLDADAYEEARYKMMSFKDDKGNYLGITPSHLLVCPALEGTAKEIVAANAQNLASGASNVWAGSAQVVVVPGLDSGDFTALKAWALADLTKPVKPFIDQVREPVQFAALESSTDYAAFMHNEYRYGANYRGAAGYGLWQLIYISDGSGS